jgi:hypothetical protein
MADTMLGSLLDISSNYYQYETQSVLNAITMAAGSSNGLWNQSVAMSTGAGSSYGCNDYRTIARPQVFAILLALMTVLFIILVMTISDILWNKKSKFQPVVGSLPVDLLDWQLALTKKLVDDDHVTRRDLAGCEYSWNKETHAIVCRKIGEHKVSFHFYLYG